MHSALLINRRPPGAWIGTALAAVGALLFTLFAPIGTARAAPCDPCSLFGTAAPTAATTDSDTVPVELGVRFRPDTDGRITAVRFWKDAANTGTHTGRLWNTATGTATSVTFTGETASGWQTATFPTPVPVTAGTTYIASYVAPGGRYTVTPGFFAADHVTERLTAPASDGAQGNGVYSYSPGAGMPDSSYSASNYWVDVSFVPGADTTAPTVTHTSPADQSTGAPVTGALSATFSEPVQPGTAAWSVTPAGGTPLAGTAGYSGTTATFQAAAPLAPSTVHTVTLTGATDAAGHPMAPRTWTFTTGDGTVSETRTGIWNGPVDPGVPAQPDDNPVEVGVKFRTTADGAVTSIRFWKTAASTGPYTVNLWDKATGERLATVPGVTGSGTGWQTVDLATPAPVRAGVTYIASYFAPHGGYAESAGYFGAPVGNDLISALADGVDGGNGVYKYNAGSTLPTDSWSAANYWVDVIFSTNAEDTVAPAITARTPAAGAGGVLAGIQPSVGFSEPLDPAGLAFTLKRGGVPVPAGSEFDDPAGPTRITLQPDTPLDHGTPYTLTVTGARDRSGNAMPDSSWNFTTGQAPPAPPCSAPGTGPILVLKSDADPYSCYYTEILRAEGLNSFAVQDVAGVDAAVLARYSTVLLGDFAPSATLVTDLTAWVNAGGNLIAMHPRASLSGLLGLGSAGGFRSDQYLKVDPGTAAGAGVHSQTSMQYHGPADIWSPPAGSGTVRVADLYTRTGTSPLGPAVTTRAVGAGTASAFTYDLARSIVQTRQGDPAQSGRENDDLPDGGGPLLRADDLFYPDWIDLSRVHVPQADEQQRLLANLITVGNRDSAPVPRLWYLPGDASTPQPDLHEVALVSTGDNHGQNLSGIGGRIDRYNANSADPACRGTDTAARDQAVRDWKCMRGTMYVWGPGPNGTQAPTEAAVAGWTAQGFEIARHVDDNGNCPQLREGDTPADVNAKLVSIYQNSLADFTRYQPLKAVTNRTHCLSWPDWTTNASIARQNGIRLDTNYYYMPDYWKNTWGGPLMKNSPGFFTGSGFPMRFADTDGRMLDIYQGVTQINDEFQQVYPFSFDRLVENARVHGYYGAFIMNNHTDSKAANGGGNVGQLDIEQALIDSARAHAVPVISAKQLLEWTDARNASTITGLARSGNTVTFTVNRDAAAANLMAMLPTTGSGGTTLTALSRGGTAVPFQKTTIKGVEYAVFEGTSGGYTATYTAPAAPAVTRAAAQPAPAGEGVLTWGTDVPATTGVELGTTPGNLPITWSRPGTAGEHRVELAGLKPGTTYYYRVTAVNAVGVRTVWPAEDEPPARFSTPAADRTAPKVRDVSIRTWPDGRADVTWRTSEPATTTVYVGDTPATARPVFDSKTPTTEHSAKLGGLAAGRKYALRIVSADASGNEGTWSPRGSRTAPGGDALVMPRPGVAQTGSQGFGTGELQGVVVSEEGAGGLTLPARATAGGSYVSAPLDAGRKVTWLAGEWRAHTPSGTAVKVLVRTGTTAEPGAGWTPWRELGSSGDPVGGTSRYLQYRVELTSGGALAPRLEGIGFTHDGPAATGPPIGEAGPATGPSEVR